jgi:hypothetical protein
VGRRLFPSGCKGLAEAVDRLVAGFSPDDLLDLDAQAEETVKSRFTALVHVCLSPANMLKDVQAALLETASAFAATRLPEVSVAQLFLEQQADEQAAEWEAATFYAEAAPELGPGREARRSAPAAELCVVALPAGQGGEELRGAIGRALPGTEVQWTGSPDDVVLYRERSNLLLADLEQLGAQARDAYLQMRSTEHFTPHTRTDVPWKLGE